MDSPACCCPAGAPAALRLPTAKEAGQETASTRRTARKIALQLLDTRLGRVQRLLLNDNCLRHEVRRGRLCRDTGADEAVRLGIARSGLTVDLAQLAE
jgi:hypothetical protein